MKRHLDPRVLSGLLIVLMLGLLPMTDFGSRGRVGLGPASAQRPSAGAAANRLPGETATSLPDGAMLLLGGERRSGPVATATIENPKTGSVTPLATAMLHARAWQTATVLPDGKVLIFGGVGSDGHIVRTAELFDPATKQFENLPPLGVMPRARHTATLLTDGTVLFAGGEDQNGQTLRSAQIWNPRTDMTTAVPGGLVVPTEGQTAALQADGTVLLWGGKDSTGSVLKYGEIYDPATQSFSLQNSPLPKPQVPLQVMATIPEDGSQKVPLSALISIRFSAPVDMQSVNAETTTLSDSDGNVTCTVVAAGGGMLEFVTPKKSLAPGTAYKVDVNGVSTAKGSTLSGFSFTFATAGQSPSSGGEVGLPNSMSWPGGPKNSPFLKLPPLQAPPGVTAISGQVLLLNGLPLKHVTLRVGKDSTQSDGTGRFLLPNVPSGHDVLVMDGRTANTKSETYGVFEVGVNVSSGQTHVLKYTIWMPALDTADAVTIPVPTTKETVITTPLIPGLEFHIPAGTTITDIDGKVVNKISITPIPVSQPPFPLPTGVHVPTYFTIQPGGGWIWTSNPNGPKGGWLVYPNTYRQPPGSPFDFWNYSAKSKGWYIYGQGKVSPDQKSIVPNPGVVIYELTGAMEGGSSQGAGSGQSWMCKNLHIGCEGEPVDTSTGLFDYTKTDLYEPDVIPIVLKRSYRQNDPTSRAFGVGTSLPYDMFLVGDTFPYTYMNLVFADGSRIDFTRISADTSYNDAVFQSKSTPEPFFGAIIAWNGNGWTLTRRDGMKYVFPDSFNSTRAEQGGLLSITDRNGNTLTITRDSNSNITQITSPNGRWVTFTYDSSYRITQATDELGRTVTYTYDTCGTGLLCSVTDANGGVWKYTYDAYDNMISITDPRNITYLTNQYDSLNRVVKQTMADSGTYQFNYTTNSNGNITQTDVTDPDGNVTRYTFGSPPIFSTGFVTGGNVSTVTYAYGTPLAQTYTYDAQPGTNLLASVMDPLGRETTYTYDVLGNATSVTRLAGTSNAVTTSFTYDGTFSDPTSVTDPLGHVTKFAYDSSGNLVSITDPLGRVTKFTTDGEGRVLSVTDPASETTHFSYDGPDLDRITDPLNRATQFFHDSAGRLIGAVSPLGQVTGYAYNPLDQITSITDALGGVTSFTYDGDGDLLSVADPQHPQNPTTYAYDNMDRLETRTDPLGKPEGYQYDGNGNLTQFTDRDGQVTTYQYDALNRLSFLGFGTGSGQSGPTYASTITYGYDAGNRLTQAADSVAGTFTRNYDGLNRLTEEQGPEGTVSYLYDADGRRTQMTVSGQSNPVTYAYDNDNRLTGITQGTAGVSFTYDAAGRRSSLTLPDGVVVNYGYDAASELTGLTYSEGGNVLGNLTYAYDGDGRRIQMGGSWARTGTPNPTTSTAVYNADNELTNWNGATLGYDSNGNLVNDSANTYTWNARNELSSIAGTNTASFEYGPFGRRLQKTVNGSTTDFLYDGVNPVQELSGGTVDANMLDGLGVDEYFQRADLLGTWDYLDDALGSTLALTDASGTVQTQYTYSPFGSTTTQGQSSSNSFQFTGRENDGDGLYYYRARYYDPMLSRFISQDPLRLASGGVNLYLYVGDDPTAYVDPLGLHKKPIQKNPLKKSPLGPFQRVEQVLTGHRPAPPKGCKVIEAAELGGKVANFGVGAAGEEGVAAKSLGGLGEVAKGAAPELAIGQLVKTLAGCGQ